MEVKQRGSDGPPRSRLSGRRALRRVGGLGLGLALAPRGRRVAAGQGGERSSLDHPAGVELPLKCAEQDMAGFTGATGEVLGFGEAPPGTIPYAVAAVPHVDYFNMDAEALHGAYWHDNFGQKMSHGCVNQPLDFAAWLYGWAPIGTGVWVHA